MPAAGIMGSITEAIGKRTELSHDGRDVAITLAVCLFLATLTTGLRFWLSRRRRPLFSMPESMTLASLVSAVDTPLSNNLRGPLMVLLASDGHNAALILLLRRGDLLEYVYATRPS